ncbi:hypothetical protein AHAS_Ahas13G0061400 [Arachis hypogaea]
MHSVLSPVENLTQWKAIKAKVPSIPTSSTPFFFGKRKQQQHSSTIKNNDKVTIDILSFEVANVMSKTVHLHKSLPDSEISRLRNEILTSEVFRSLVSSDHSYLLDLALAEKHDELNRVAGVVSRLGKKCSVLALQGFEHVYGDIVSGVIDVNELRFLVKHMELWKVW